MHNMDIETNRITGDKVYKTVLSNGLRVYIHPKKGFVNKIGLFGTLYGSIDNDFIDITTGERNKVPDGIAHFLEHKLFEKEGDSILDIFAKMGVNCNAYTSFDHTVYYFETDKDCEICLNKLIYFVSEPYFTDENVEKEKGIIAQEINMYEDDPNSVVYDNLLKAMYVNSPLKIDIAGTIHSISEIDKELLYKCYNTFYNPKNMFVVVIGDVDVNDTINILEKSTDVYMKRKISEEVQKFAEKEPEHIVQNQIQKNMSLHTPLISFGFKMNKRSGIENIKNNIILSIINETCFSNMSDFYERLYKNNIITHEPSIYYESGDMFSYIVIAAYAENIDIFEKEMIKYLKEIKENGINKDIFDVVKSKKIGEYIYNLENSTYMHRTIIESIIQKTEVYESQDILENISIEEINKFILESLDFTKMVISKVLPN